MKSTTEYLESLREWIAAKNGAISPGDIAVDMPIFASGLLKSVHVTELILFIEEISGRRIDVEQLVPGAFRDIAAIESTFLHGTNDE